MKNKQQSFFEEFLLFLKEYKVVSLAIAFIIGEASTVLMQSLVKDIILPLAAPLMAAETWREAVFVVGPVRLSYGAFLADLINFIILAFVIFLVARKVMKMKKEGS